MADDAALQFATFIRTIALRFLNGAGEWGAHEEITISGEDFQNWVLKLIVNHAVGKAFNGNKAKFPREAVDLLLGRAMWPRNWGLCVAGDLSHDELRYRPFDRVEDSTTDWWSVQPLVHRDGWVGGGIVNLNGIGLGLTVFDPSRDNPDAFDNNPQNPLRGLSTEVGPRLISETFAYFSEGIEHRPDAVGGGSDVVEVFAISIWAVRVQLVQCGATPECQFLAEVRVIGDFAYCT
nr:hypothetical protein [Mycobacterium montefiorense]